MMLRLQLAALAAFASLFANTGAHPGEDHHEELMQRAEWLKQVERRDLSHCAEKLKARGMPAQLQAMRNEMVKEMRVKRGLSASGEIFSTMAS